MLVYSEDLLVEHLEGAISSVGTEWQKGNRMERKKTKHVNNAKEGERKGERESGRQNQKVVGQNKRGRHFSTSA